MKRKRKKITYKRTIIVGFAALYITSMLLSTYLVKCKYEESYNRHLSDLQDGLYTTLFTADSSLAEDNEESKKQLKGYALNLVSSLRGEDPYQQLSAALFDMGGELLAVTSNMFGETIEEEGNKDYAYFPMDEYLTEEEQKELAGYYDSESELMNEKAVNQEEATVVTSYVLCGDYDKETKEPTGLYMLERQVGFANETPYESVDSWNPDPVWEWKNPDYNSDKTNIMIPIDGNSRVSVQFPYIMHGTKAWERWQQDDWLQSLADYDMNHREKQTDQDGLIRETYLNVAVGGQTSGFCMLVIRQTAYPWLAAVDYMKYVYLMGALLMIVCAIKVMYSTGKAYKEREQIETMRRDFTNAAAHELKTPLSVIRGFAENLKENTVEEKKDYYLEQIILQTEQMDELVKEMIQISKLDSEKLAFNRETLSMSEIIDSQLIKFDSLMKEKNLKVICDKEEEFILEGENLQVEKMIWNLLSNAVEYNKQNGQIWISIRKDRIAIENSGTPIPKEKMDHIFEMFYTGDESRHERSRHMGLGLYLAKRICDSHGLKLVVCNTDEGVRAAIHR